MRSSTRPASSSWWTRAYLVEVIAWTVRGASRSTKSCCSSRRWRRSPKLIASDAIGAGRVRRYFGGPPATPASCSKLQCVRPSRMGEQKALAHGPRGTNAALQRSVSSRGIPHRTLEPGPTQSHLRDEATGAGLVGEGRHHLALERIQKADPEDVVADLRHFRIRRGRRHHRDLAALSDAAAG